MLATNNLNKLREVKEILSLPETELVVPAMLGQPFVVSEDGSSFEANARLKARAAFKQFGLPALADDSGLEIEALGGQPGVHSARFLDGASYEEKCRAILRMMAGVPDNMRGAQFRCCAVLVEQEDLVHVFEGQCAGSIIREARGSNGFGYDPIFVPEGFELTFAELGGEEKNRISHRAKAFEQVREFLAPGTARR